MLGLFGILGGVIAVGASVPYIADIIRGKTKPHRMAWVIFVTLSGISFFAQFAEGATNSLWFPLVLFVQAIIIFFLTLKYGVGGHKTFDTVSLLLAVLILVLWGITESASLAIICAISINTIGKILVALKVYRMPHTEYLPTWIWSAVASLFACLAVGDWNWILIITPLQNGITVGLIALLIIMRRRQVAA